MTQTKESSFSIEFFAGPYDGQVLAAKTRKVLPKSIAVPMVTLDIDECDIEAGYVQPTIGATQFHRYDRSRRHDKGDIRGFVYAGVL
jgi:hypothetical protein